MHVTTIAVDHNPARVHVHECMCTSACAHLLEELDDGWGELILILVDEAIYRIQHRARIVVYDKCPWLLGARIDAPLVWLDIKALVQVGEEGEVVGLGTLLAFVINQGEEARAARDEVDDRLVVIVVDSRPFDILRLVEALLDLEDVVLRSTVKGKGFRLKVEAIGSGEV